MATIAVKQPETGAKERFYRYFQQEVTALTEQMDRLGTTSLAGGERTDAADHCLAGIGHLSTEVQDAASYIPAYDQRTYAETIKALMEKLHETRAAVLPKQRFSFKTTRKNASAISLQDAAELASSQRLQIPGSRSTTSSGDSSPAPTPESRSPPNGDARGHSAIAMIDTASEKEVNDEPCLLNASSLAICETSLSQSKSIVISNREDVHIILPPSTMNATSSGSLQNLHRCVVDMSLPTASTSGGQPFAGLTLRDIRQSLIICGHIQGPTHVTNVENSVVVTACRQFRMHDCRDVDIYLLCTSRPIIEGCSRIRFAPLPEYILSSANMFASIPNQYDQVDDFKWLKSGHSPNWRVLPTNERIARDVWEKIVPGGPQITLEQILAKTVGVKSREAEVVGVDGVKA